MTDHTPLQAPKKWNFDEVISRQGTDSVKWDPKYLRFQFGKGKEELLPLWVADMDFRCPPVVTEALSKRVAHGIFGYTFLNRSYFEALITWYKTRHQWAIEKEWCVSSPGIVPAINFIIQRFSSPGDKVLIQTPVYYPFAEAIRNNGRQLVENSLQIDSDTSQYEMDFHDSEKQCQDPRVKIAILCSPHNPVGRVWSKTDLEQFGRICIDNNVLIIADEIHCDLILPGFKHVCFASLSEEFAQHSITCNAGSKTFNLAGLHQSNVIIPNPQIRANFQTHLENLGLSGTTIFGPIALQAAYTGAASWLDDLLQYLQANFVYLKHTLEESLSGVKVLELQGTYLVWVDFRALEFVATPQDLKRIIEDGANLAFDDGLMFGSNGAGFQRINIACPRRILVQALDQWHG